MRAVGLSCPGSIRTFRQISSMLFGVLMFVDIVSASSRLPPEIMRQMPHPWPPVDWSLTLDLPDTAQTAPHHSEPKVHQGYFGQTLYQQIAGTSAYVTANVLIQDRGDKSAAWRAVSAVRCKSRNFRGYRARECSRGSGPYSIRTLHYEVDRFYVTIQLSGPIEADYPLFDVGAMNPMTAPRTLAPRRRGNTRR